MSLAERQETPRALQLLKAQRHTYSVAKRFRVARVVASAGIAILAPIVALAWPDGSIALAGVGTVFAAVAQLLIQPHEKRLVTRGAHLQDQFDAYVFGFPHRRHADVVDEETAKAARRCANPESLSRWYETTDKLPDPLLALLAQRSSLVWNVRQRKYYAVVVGLALVALFLLDFAVGRKMTTEAWMISFIMPSFPGFMHGIEVMRDHRTARLQETAALEEVERLWTAAVREPSILTPEVLRGVQDLLLRLRAEHAPVPDWLHRRLRRDFELDGKEALEQRALEFQGVSVTRAALSSGDTTSVESLAVPQSVHAKGGA